MARLFVFGTQDQLIKGWDRIKGKNGLIVDGLELREGGIRKAGNEEVRSEGGRPPASELKISDFKRDATVFRVVNISDQIPESRSGH